MRKRVRISFWLAFFAVMPLTRCTKFGDFWQDPAKQVVADTQAPSSPTSFAAVQGGSTQINLSWVASTDETTVQSALVYEICQATSAGACATFAVSFTTTAGATAFAATGLTPSSPYFYRIRARDGAGNLSIVSPEVSATTAAPGVVNSPVFSPLAGTYNSTQNVTITSSTGGATICYAFDPQTPACDATPVCTTGTQYSGPVAITTTNTLRAIACLAGNTDSSVTSGVYTIDALAPNVMLVNSSTADGTYATGQNISIQVTFDEVVNVTGTPQLELATTSPPITAVNYTSGSGTTTLTFSYTVASGHTSTDLDFASNTALILNGGTILDAAGNAANLLLPLPGAVNSLGANKAIVIDGAAPSVTLVTASSTDGNYGVGSVIQIEVWFNETLTVTGTPTLTLATGSPATTAVGYAFGSGSAILRFNYTIAAGNSSADLDYASSAALALAGGTITDASGNAAVLTLPAPGGLNSLSDSKALVVDGSVPTVTGVTTSVADGTYGQGSVIPIRVMFSENVFVGGSPQLTLTTGSPITTIINYVSGSGTNMLDFQYTVANGNNSGDLDYANTAALSLNGGSIQDAAGNQAVLTLAAPGTGGSLGGGRSLVIDGIAPNITGIAPVSSTNVIDTVVSYTLSENCATGSIVWTRTGGTTDPGSPRNQALTGAELTAGPHNSITITNNPALVPGAIYTLQFNCADAAGNASAAPPSTNVMFAPPGVLWTQRTMPTSASWYSMAFGNGVFVALAGAGSTNIAATSPDGINWTQRTMSATATWQTITFGNGIFLAIANGTVAASSPDGITWTARTMPVAANWYHVTYGNSTFVAVAYGGTTAATSPDGITWTQRTLPASGNWYWVEFGNGTFVATMYDSSSIAATSPDGITWTQRAMPVSASWRSVAYGNGIFVAMAAQGGSTMAATSPDGISWTQRTLPAAAVWYPVAFGNGYFVTIGFATSMAAISADGITWTQRPLPISASWQYLTYGNGKFVAVATGPSTTAATSP